MSTPAKTPRKTAAQHPDAYALLKADHAEVKKLFKAYQKLADAEADATERQELAQRICSMLTVHTTIEEEIFYPAAREVLGEKADLVDEADVEHASAKELIAQLQSAQPDQDDHYDARVKVLGEYIEHHVKEEEEELFTSLKKTPLDAKALGDQLAERKQALMAEMGEPESATA